MPTKKIADEQLFSITIAPFGASEDVTYQVRAPSPAEAVKRLARFFASPVQEVHNA